MKKIFFSLAAVLFAATTFAQGIVLEHTFNGRVGASSAASMENPALGNLPNVDDFDDCFYSISGTTLSWWDENYTQHNLAVAPYPQGIRENDRYIVTAAHNVFTDDNRMCFVFYDVQDTESGISITFYVYDELGTLLISQTCPGAYLVYIAKMFGAYKLIAFGTEHTYVYSLPGQGKTAAGNEIIQDAPHRGRKYVQDALVLVEENDRTYNMSGTRIK